MLIELLNVNNYISFNIKTAQIFGLTTAVYYSELLKIYDKAKAKNKLIDDNYFKLERKYIFVRTTISIEEQLRIDAKLMMIGLLSKHKDTPDSVKLDLKLYASIISNEDIELIEDLTKRFSEVTKKNIKESKRQAIIRALKDSIQITDYELLTALRNWVDAIFASPKGNYLSKISINLFIETLNNYTKGDLDLALRLVNIAIIRGYRDCNWAISVYEKDTKMKKSLESKNPRVTTQKRGSSDKLGDDVY